MFYMKLLRNFDQIPQLTLGQTNFYFISDSSLDFNLDVSQPLISRDECIPKLRCHFDHRQSVPKNSFSSLKLHKRRGKWKDEE